MKKIALFSLVLLAGVGCIGAVMADNSCRQITNGAVICGTIPVGGAMESGRCRNDDGSYKGVGSLCDPLNAPENYGHCIESNNQNQTSCAAEKCNEGYLLYTTAKRQEIPVVGTNKKVGSQGICTSRQSLKDFCETKCNCDVLGTGYKCVLNEVRVNNKGYNDDYLRTVDLPNVPAYIGEEVCVCKKDNVVQETCETEYAGYPKAIDCCNAKKNGENVEWVGNKADGYCKCNEDNKKWDETNKKCENSPVADGTSVDCLYTLNVDIQCKNGKTFKKNRSVTLSKEKVTEQACDVLKQNMKDLERLVTTTQSEVNSYADLIMAVCGDGSTSVTLVDQKKIDDAKSKLKQFFADAEENASVWHKEDGSFNTARLASDLTAGVVLGTVGGVVSGHIIKKKQIEKGFEVLHCTVGGQTIADWGDEFSVGLKR